MRRYDLNGPPRVRRIQRAARVPRFVSEVPPNAPLWLRLHHVADRHIPEFQTAMSSYRDSLLAALPLADLTNALSTSDPFAMMEALLVRLRQVEVGKAVFADDPLEGISATYRNIILGGAKEALSLEPEILQRLPFLVANLNLTNRYAVQYAQTMGSTLIRQVNAQTIEAVRAIVGSALRSATAMSPVQQAKLIREVVGLTARQSAQVARYHNSLTGSPASIEKRTKALADRLHRRRSITIARTETIRASNAGVRMLGDELRALPFMRETDLRYVWITTPDDRLCSRCSPMHNQVVGYDSDFTEDPAMARRPFSGRNPPLHPMCRCAIARKVESIEELEQRIADYEGLDL